MSTEYLGGWVSTESQYVVRAEYLGWGEHRAFRMGEYRVLRMGEHGVPRIG